MAKTENLQSLVDLAKEPSGERRRELLREVTDLFMEAPEQLNEREVAHFSDIMGKVAFELETKVRQELSERLADSDLAPRDLVTKLAKDEIDVARPILTKSSLLKSEDLIEIIREHGQDHMMAISVRENVAEDVADCLVENGDDEVLESLVQNDGADLSRTAMETVVARSENNEKLQAPLVGHKNLPPDLMNEMFFWVSNALRDQILENNDKIDPAILDQALANTKTSLQADVSEIDKKWAQPERFIRRKERVGELNQDLLVQLLRQGKMPEFTVGFARLSELDIRTAQRIISGSSIEALAISCKAIGFDRASFSNLVLLTDTNKSHKPEDVNSVMTLYDKVSPHSAQRTLRFWRARHQTMKKSAAEKAAGSFVESVTAQS